MTSSPSPPDLSSLSISPSQQRLHDTYDYEGAGGGRHQYNQFSTSPPLSGQSQYASMGASPLKNRPTRGGLPTQWLDNTTLADERSFSPPNNSDLASLSSGGGSPPMGHISGPPPMVGTPPIPMGDDDVIPTAIVIKNIPFNVKRETLLDLIASLQIPTPYAFNYHLDQSGAFRGLAFANFRQAADADAVVVALNGFDVQGRKLRVEYKKVLQAGEKERIEREKALRRMKSMQLERAQQIQTASAFEQYDDYGTIIPPTFTPSRSFSGGLPYQSPQQYSPPQMPPITHLQSYNAAPTVPSLNNSPSNLAPAAPGTPATKSANELDLNDPATLEIYSRILLFKDDRMRDELAFSRTLSAKQRRVVHLVAQKLGVYHYSVGEGDERYAVVTRINPDAQQQEQVHQPRLSRAPSAYHLSATASSPPPSLRMKKSMPDMNALRMQAPRLNTRISNGNIREGYATIASPARRSPGALNALFGNFGTGSVPPVPSLPASVTGFSNLNGSGSINNGGSLAADSPTSGVVRQPRGPGMMGFSNRREKQSASESQAQSRSVGLEARSHEPLEI